MRRWKLAVGSAVTCIAALALWLRVSFPQSLDWPDRRPIGSLFLASHFHSSATNPRGWFNDRSLDVMTAAGRKRFAAMLLAYADRSIQIMTEVNAQGVVVWDLEGQEFPHKTSYIGDPRLVEELAPEMIGVVDEFFARFERAGLRVGVTVRPQQLVGSGANRRQARSDDYEDVLKKKIAYARQRWNATLFYLDSNSGLLSVTEPWRLRRLVQSEPEILLIPEHHHLLYWAFSTPYGSAMRGQRGTPWFVRRVYPRAFGVLNIADASGGDWLRSAAAAGDVLLFRAWFESSEVEAVRRLVYEGNMTKQ